MSGYGEYTRSDNVKYIGTWKDDVQFGIGRKIVPERIAYGPEKITSIERVFEEKWGEGKVLLSQREILIHPGKKMHEITENKSFCDTLITCFDYSQEVEEDVYLCMEDLKNVTMENFSLSYVQKMY